MFMVSLNCVKKKVLSVVVSNLAALKFLLVDISCCLPLLETPENP